MATSTAIAEAKPTMAARPSHVSGPPPFFALCSHLMMDSDLLLTALQETRLLLGAADAAFRVSTTELSHNSQVNIRIQRTIFFLSFLSNNQQTILGV